MQNSPRGSKYPIFEVSGSKQRPLRVWFLEPETLNIGYLDPLGQGARFFGENGQRNRECTPSPAISPSAYAALMASIMSFIPSTATVSCASNVLQHDICTCSDPFYQLAILVGPTIRLKGVSDFAPGCPKSLTVPTSMTTQLFSDEHYIPQKTRP